MRQVLLLVAIVVCARESPSHANCAATNPVEVRVMVDQCVAVDKAKGSVLLDVHAGSSDATKVWVPATEKLTCARVKPGTTLTGTIDQACCDGDASPPCTIGAPSVLTKIKVEKSVKQETRAELEAEVEALRAEVAQLHAQEVARNEQLKRELGKLKDTLK
jgi:hypothetical protein